jgi:hypothetical protein
MKSYDRLSGPSHTTYSLPLTTYTRCGTPRASSQALKASFSRASRKCTLGLPAGSGSLWPAGGAASRRLDGAVRGQHDIERQAGQRREEQ